jgi:IS1 family transposase
MNILSMERARDLLAALCSGGLSERQISQHLNINRRTIASYVLKFGEAADHLHNRVIREMNAPFIVMDEVWSFVHKKRKNLRDDDPVEWGDAYTFIAMDKSTRLIISYFVGPRNEASTQTFINDLRARLSVMPEITSDGWSPYIDAVERAFGRSVDYAQTVKNYNYAPKKNTDPDAAERFITKRVIFGAPPLERQSTAYMRRKFLGFSKTIRHLKAAIALFTVYYNFCHVNRTFKATAAQTFGLVDRPWTIDVLLNVLMHERASEPPLPRALVHRPPETTSRPLPSGGFLRVTGTGKPGVDKPDITSDEKTGDGSKGNDE